MPITDHQSKIIDSLKTKNEQFDEEGYPFTNRFVLLLCSYCSDNPQCTDFRPCFKCLQMSNIGIMEDGNITGVCGYDYIKDLKL